MVEYPVYSAMGGNAYVKGISNTTINTQEAMMDLATVTKMLWVIKLD